MLQKILIVILFGLYFMSIKPDQTSYPKCLSDESLARIEQYMKETSEHAADQAALLRAQLSLQKSQTDLLLAKLTEEQQQEEYERKKQRELLRAWQQRPWYTRYSITAFDVATTFFMKAIVPTIKAIIAQQIAHKILDHAALGLDKTTEQVIAATIGSSFALYPGSWLLKSPQEYQESVFLRSCLKDPETKRLHEEVTQLEQEVKPQAFADFLAQRRAQLYAQRSNWRDASATPFNTDSSSQSKYTVQEPS